MSKTIELVCDESVDISVVGELYTKVTSEMEDGCTISFDASQVERVDTAALQFFAVLFNDARYFKKICTAAGAWRAPAVKQLITYFVARG